MGHSIHEKFTTNLPSLQESIDAQEAAFAASGNINTSIEPRVEGSEETHVQSILPIDQLNFNFKGIAHTALHLDPTKRNVVSLLSLYR